MHVLIPFAALTDSSGAAAMPQGLQWPQLSLLLARMHEVDRDRGEATSFSAPHERVLARALGWPVDDGRLPWAARAARAAGVAVGETAWGLITPVHWHVGTDQVSLVDPAGLMLTEADAKALHAAALPLFADLGWQLHYHQPHAWFAAHESLAGLRTASLDRVIGRNVDAWLGTEPAARAVRRLQAEVQMLWHGHAVNEAREQRGLAAVNSFWISGCGVARPEPPGPAPEVNDSLRASALAGDVAAWCKAWEQLDATLMPALALAQRRGAELALTLAGERDAVTFASSHGGFVQRLKSLWQRPDLPRLLATL